MDTPWVPERKVSMGLEDRHIESNVEVVWQPSHRFLEVP